MENALLGFPNRIDGSTLSNGSYTAGLPLTNAQTRVLGQVARSTDATTASTKVDIDIGSTKNIKAIAVLNHNFSLAATYRWRGSSVSNFASTLYDSGSTFTDVWPVVYPYASLDWEDDNWWSGRYSEEQIAGYTTALIIILPSNVAARYWRLEIDDTANSDGYVEFGRIFIGPAWQATFNHQEGRNIGWKTKTGVQEALSGAEYFDVHTPYRTALLALDWLTEDEAFANAFEIQRRAGIDKEVLWVHSIDDTVHALRRRFLGRIEELSPIEYPYLDVNKTAFRIKELL